MLGNVWYGRKWSDGRWKGCEVGIMGYTRIHLTDSHYVLCTMHASLQYDVTEATPIFLCLLDALNNLTRPKLCSTNLAGILSPLDLPVIKLRTEFQNCELCINTPKLRAMYGTDFAAYNGMPSLLRNKIHRSYKRCKDIIHIKRWEPHFVSVVPLL